MFTGIIEETGKIQSVTTDKIFIEADTVLQGTKVGDSIAVDGVCLTVTEINNKIFTADVSAETFKVTALKNLKSGSAVNLERAMHADGRFGGHIVSGHIDGTGKIVKLKKENEFYDIEIELSPENSKYVVRKGSVTVNGISLTVADVNADKIRIAVIPHTFRNTNLNTLQIGSIVNIETDILAKYVEKFLSTGDNRTGIDMEFLLENGFN